MAVITFDPKALLLSTLFLASGYLTKRCLTRPNPPPEKQSDTKEQHDDRIMANTAVRQTTLMAPWIACSVCIYHAFIALTYPSPPKSICPHPEWLNSALFTWSTFTSICLAIHFIGGAIRLLAYAQLGESFTFELAKPKKGLITSGVYRYIRHPSYTGAILLSVTCVGLVFRSDGVSACWLEPGAGARGVITAVLSAVSLLGLIVFLPMRLRDEEQMMHWEFGKEWEEYSRRTWRLIPGIF
ncbi:hypothetical protein L228DRAFT_242657 [Xylona heveae TC161]|uniref:Protein-S-isoprenylcysteine O-methyltransferase n=1 Tax=Xylona heveae (strain CBS 132557 / TC161) TaxID=1328760 RepID=A0A165JGV0_XYLHT|nr:hypothetical protein L228DRAFT_242657 [Xylona heveae TC161]KZF26221.1 hypothetical protein L228DRAFT_242657 [Xylona heveae TC161]